MLKYIYTVLLLSFCSCNFHQSNETLSAFHVIDIERSLSDFKITSLSSYSSKIRYVKLETRDDCLVSQEIKKIHLEQGKIFINDDAPYLKVFDAYTGKYLYNIGKKGQGPGELAYLNYFDISPEKEQIILSGTGRSYRFSFDGTFIDKVDKPTVDSIILDSNVVFLDNDLYAASLRYPKEPQEYALILFDEQMKITNSLRSYRDPIQHPTIKVWSPLIQSGFFYRNGQDVRYYRGICDTIYTYNSNNQSFVPAFCFDWGKHQPHLFYDPSKQNPDEIWLSQKTISENTRFVFFDFLSKRASPEPFKERVYRVNRWFEITNSAIYGIYDKQEEKLHFLLQPIPGVRGLKNDLDGGIPFWPKSISSDYQMVDYYHTSRFLEIADKLDNPDKSFSEFVRTCSEEDNPVIIITK